MFKFKNDLLPINFKTFFVSITDVHKYETRSASKNNFYIPKIKTNYGKFNIEFKGTQIWNSLDEKIRNKAKKIQI